MDLGFGGGSVEGGAAHTQQNTDETPANCVCQPTRWAKAISGDCSVKFILPACFNMIGLFPCLSLALKLARVTVSRLWRLLKQGKPLTVGVMGWFQGGHESSNCWRCSETRLGDLLPPFPAQRALQGYLGLVAQAWRGCAVWEGFILSIALA